MKEITYKLINQVKDKLKVKKNYKGLLSVSTYLVSFYMEDYYKEEEYEYFTEYKSLVLIIELMRWLAVANNRHQFGFHKFNYKKYLQEAEEELSPVKKEIFSLWQNSLLDNKVEEITQIISGNISEAKKRDLSLYKEMLSDLLRMYPEYNSDKEVNFKLDIGLC